MRRDGKTSEKTPLVLVYILSNFIFFEQLAAPLFSYVPLCLTKLVTNSSHHSTILEPAVYHDHGN